MIVGHTILANTEFSDDDDVGLRIQGVGFSESVVVDSLLFFLHYS